MPSVIPIGPRKTNKQNWVINIPGVPLIKIVTYWYK
jgi:hypothetical protein